MFNTRDFAQDILAQEINPARSNKSLGISLSNRRHLITVIFYQHLTNGWDDAHIAEAILDRFLASNKRDVIVKNGL